MVTLREEMENAVSYLELMKARYEDGFSYVMEIQEECRDICLPKMVIQPIVENCFTHGFADREPPYFIRIAAGMEQDGWVVTIADNGVGITDAQREALFQKVARYEKNLSGNLQESHISGLGLVSTILRLRLSLPDAFSFDIRTNSPQGAAVILRGRQHAENTDRRR